MPRRWDEPRQGGGRLPKGEYGVDGWIHDAETVARMRELYPPSSVMREKMENDRRVFLNAMAQIKQRMVLGRPVFAWAYYVQVMSNV